MRYMDVQKRGISLQNNYDQIFAIINRKYMYRSYCVDKICSIVQFELSHRIQSLLLLIVF